MTEFEKYLEDLSDHESLKYIKGELSSRNKILISAGVSLNWLGDFFANPEIKWTKHSFDINDIEFTGTSLEWNEILIDKCERKPASLISLLKNNPEIGEKLKSKASYNPNLPILVRKSDKIGKFKVLDGMHRLVGLVLNGDKIAEAYYPENEESVLPYCEAHVVYDLIRGFMRNARDEDGEKELYYSLKLLLRSYGNVKDLLINRFNTDHVKDDTVQAVIKKVIQL